MLTAVVQPDPAQVLYTFNRPVDAGTCLPDGFTDETTGETATAVDQSGTSGLLATFPTGCDVGDHWFIEDQSNGIPDQNGFMT